jgi:DNA gyrase subunit A
LASGSSERFLEKLKDSVESEKIVGVIDAQDHSSRDGIEIQVILKTGVEANTVISQLLAFTNLADSIGVNATAISSGLPTIFGVKDIIAEWYGARCKALKSRYVAECDKLSSRVHILDGLLTILADIDEVIKLIRGSKTKEIAAGKLKKRWKLSDIQVQAVLSMPLSRLVGVERLELESEKADLEAKIANLTDIVTNPVKMDEHIISQINDFKEFVDKRRSMLVEKQEIGIEKAKITTQSGTRRVKMPSPKDRIKEEGKRIGMKRSELSKFFTQMAGKTNIKAEWDQFKEDWNHSQQLSTRKGRAERKILLDKIKEGAVKKGMPSRGKHSWASFMKEREDAKIKSIENDLKEWMKNIPKPSK